MNQTLDAGFFYQGVGGLLVSNILVGLPANVYVVWLIGPGSAQAEIFALNLAVCEILFCCSSLYVVLLFLLGRPLDLGVLVLKLFLQLMLVSRPLFQTCICVERYLAVVHPILFPRFRSLRVRLVCCAWFLMILDCSSLLLQLSMATTAYLFVSKCLVFLVLLVYCGVRVLVVLKQPGPGNAETWNILKRKAFQVIWITLAFNGSTQLLQGVMLTPALLGASLTLILQVALLSMAISILSSFLTPVLYLHRSGKLPCI